jgi:hypothetical protein
MNPEEIAARKKALRSYIRVFLEEEQKTDQVDLVIDVSKAAENVCDLYVRYADEVIRPTIASGIIQNYKIISYLEVAVLRVRPIDIPGADELEILWYTAKLAAHIAITFLLEWNEIDVAKFNALIVKDEQLASFLREHIKWLAHLDVRYYFPGFLNAQTWELFYYLVSDRVKLL